MRKTGPNLATRNTSPRAKKKPAKETVVVVDGKDEEEGEKDTKTNLPTSLDQTLATTFSLDSAGPNVAAKASISAQARGPVAARADCVGRHAREVFK